MARAHRLAVELLGEGQQTGATNVGWPREVSGCGARSDAEYQDDNHRPYGPFYWCGAVCNYTGRLPRHLSDELPAFLWRDQRPLLIEPFGGFGEQRKANDEGF